MHRKGHARTLSRRGGPARAIQAHGAPRNQRRHRRHGEGNKDNDQGVALRLEENEEKNAPRHREGTREQHKVAFIFRLGTRGSIRALIQGIILRVLPLLDVAGVVAVVAELAAEVALLHHAGLQGHQDMPVGILLRVLFYKLYVPDGRAAVHAAMDGGISLHAWKQKKNTKKNTQTLCLGFYLGCLEIKQKNTSP